VGAGCMLRRRTFSCPASNTRRVCAQATNDNKSAQIDLGGCQSRCRAPAGNRNNLKRCRYDRSLPASVRQATPHCRSSPGGTRQRHSCTPCKRCQTAMRTGHHMTRKHRLASCVSNHIVLVDGRTPQWSTSGFFSALCGNPSRLPAHLHRPPNSLCGIAASCAAQRARLRMEQYPAAQIPARCGDRVYGASWSRVEQACAASTRPLAGLCCPLALSRVLLMAYQRSTHLSLREAQGRGLPDREHQVAAQLHRLLHVHLRAIRSPVWRIVQDGFNSFHTRKVD